MPIVGLHNDISQERLAAWAERFRFYRDAPSAAQIQSWLKYFSKGEQSVAAKILDETRLISERETILSFEESLGQIPGWQRAKKNRKGNWYFAGFGGAGESGQTMLHKFREAHNLKSAQFNYLFVDATELHRMELTSEDTVVFVDDFAGSGKQVCEFWPTLQLVMGAHVRSYLILVAATSDAIIKINQLDGLELIAAHRIENDRNIFADESGLFSAQEKQVILKYCKKVDKGYPKGFGKCGLLFVMSHNTPNNSIPILHKTKADWTPIFPRYLNAQAV